MSQQCLSVSISCLGNVATYTLIGLGLSIQILLDFCVGFLVGFFFSILNSYNVTVNRNPGIIHENMPAGS